MNYRTPTFPTLILLFLCTAARGDIIKLDSGEILNGKILQQSNTDIIFASSAQTVTVQRGSVIEVFKTASPDEDRVILERMGKSVSDTVLRHDYAEGEKKLERFLATGDAGAVNAMSKPSYDISVYGGFDRTVGSLSSVLPYGGCAGLRADSVRELTIFGLKTSLTGDLSFCRFSRGEKALSGGIFTGGGSLWYTVSGVRCFVSAGAGPSFFRIRTSGSSAYRFTAAAAAETGARFELNGFTLTPALRGMTAYDPGHPLFGVSCLLMAGFSW